MKTIKTYLTNLPSGVKTIFGINIIVYIISCISLFLFSFDINQHLGFYPTDSGNFVIYQILTFMFTHSYEPTHIFINLILFLFFSVSFEKKFGTENYYWMYVLSSLTCVLFYNTLKNQELDYCKRQLISKDVNIFSVKYSDRFKHPKEERVLIERYYDSKSYGIGASGALFGFVGSFLVFNLRFTRKIRTILLLCLASYMVYSNLIVLYPYDYTSSGSSIGHIGGLITGLIFSMFLKIKKEV
jgi:membrane associated rhomboid family serine protease